MANHQSAIKRIKQSNKRRVHNKYFAKSMRSALKTLLSTDDKKKVGEMAPKVTSMIDKLAKRNIIHANKAANLKSQVSRHAGKK